MHCDHSTDHKITDPSINDIFVHLSICPFVHLSICPFVHLYICTFVHLYICTFVHLYICTFAHLYICTFVHLYICTFVQLVKNGISQTFRIKRKSSAKNYGYTKLSLEMKQRTLQQEILLYLTTTTATMGSLLSFKCQFFCYINYRWC